MGAGATHPIVGLMVCLCARLPPFRRLHHFNLPEYESNNSYPFISGHFRMPFTACTLTCTCTSSQGQAEVSTYISVYILHPVHSTVTHQQHQLPDTSYQERFRAFLIPLTLKTSFLSVKGDVSPMPKAEDGGGLSAEVATGPAFHHRLLVIFPDRRVSSAPPGGKMQ